MDAKHHSANERSEIVIYIAKFYFSFRKLTKSTN